VPADGTAVAVFLGFDCGWRLFQPRELRVTVSEAGAGLAPLVQQRVDVGEACCTGGPRPLAPGQRDPGDLVVAQVGEGANVTRRRDDDLVVLEDGVEIGDDADRPAGRVRLAAAGPKGEGLRWRPLLAAVAERTGKELVFRREVEVRPRIRSRPPCSVRRNDDPLTGDGVLAKLRFPRGQLEAPPPFFFSRKGLSRSIGAGKTIVVDCDEPSSSSVCR